MLARTFIRRIPQSFAVRQFTAAPDAVFRASELNNGVQVISKEGDNNLVSLKFAVLGGSSAETETEKGAAHLLSVSAFAGTGEKSGLRLMRELEDIGATVSASADREKITLDVTVLPGMAEEAFERLSETIVSPPRNRVVLTDCFGTAQQAYEKMAATPKQQLSELLHEAAFGEETPMGSSTRAFNGDLKNLTPEAIMSYREHQFTGNNVVVASSGLKHGTVRKLTDKYLSALPKATAAPVDAAYSGGDAKMRADFNGHTYLALAFPVPSSAKAYNVLRVLLSNKLRKSIDIARNNGEISAFYAPYAKSGLWGFYANGVNVGVANKLIESAIKELRAVSNNNVSAEDLECAKNQLTLQKTAELECEAVTSALLSAHLTNTSPRDYANFSAVSSADVVAAAKASVAASTTPSWAVLGKTAGALTFPAVVKLLSSA